MKFSTKWISVTTDDCVYSFRGSAYTLAITGMYVVIYENGKQIREIPTYKITELKETYPC